MIEKELLKAAIKANNDIVNYYEQMLEKIEKTSERLPTKPIIAASFLEVLLFHDNVMSYIKEHKKFIKDETTKK